MKKHVRQVPKEATANLKAIEVTDVVDFQRKVPRRGDPQGQSSPFGNQTHCQRISCSGGGSPPQHEARIRVGGRFGFRRDQRVA
jgi:hypothetical protein